MVPVNLDVLCSDEISEHGIYNITSFKDDDDVTDPNPLTQCHLVPVTVIMFSVGEML